MSAIFSPTEIELLGAPHVARCWFGALDLPDGIAYLHSGVGRVTIDGTEWHGVSDPSRGQLLSVGEVTDPRFGQAAAIVLQLAGASREFIQSVHATARDIEGRSAEIYLAFFDGESQQLISGMKRLFPRGKMSSPSIQWQGIGSRLVTLTVESPWASLNFAPGGKWNGADQRRRFPGDKGLDYVGQDINESWTQQ